MAASEENMAEICLSKLSSKKATRYALSPDKEVCRSISNDLNLSEITKLRFEGEFTAYGASGWKLRAKLGATVQQSCVITLKPVTTRIDVEVTRKFVPEAEIIALDTDTELELESPEDDTLEPLRDVINLYEVIREVLDLELPQFPKASGAVLGQAVFTEPGLAPMSDQDAKPFAKLAELRQKLDK